MDAEDPLFILYTSGSTGKPKGVLHTTGGYLVYAAMTHELVFDYHEGDIYWCTADVGWVTGHSYIVYGPLANGATTLMFEGVPTWPDAGRFWAVCEKHKVNIFYTAPTAIRALMGQGREWVDKHDLSSPAHPRLGRRADQPRGLELVRRGGRPRPLPDRRHLVADRDRRHPDHAPARRHRHQARLGDPALLRRAAGGARPADRRRRSPRPWPRACSRIADSWPGQMRTIWGDHERFVDTYFSQYKGYYFTGDGCRRDDDGYYWITGRVDDVINVSGHRMGTAEVESALVAHAKVAEAAVVGYPHAIKGQGIYAYVTLMAGEEYYRRARRRSSSPGCARRSARSPPPTSSSGRRACPRPAPARSCAASCARSPRTTTAPSATPPPSPTRPSSTTSIGNRMNRGLTRTARASQRLMRAKAEPWNRSSPS